MERNNSSEKQKGYHLAPVPKPDETQIRAVFNLLMSRGTGCIEMRVLGNKTSSRFEDKTTLVGFYDDIEAFVRDAVASNARKQVYFGQNLRLPELLHAYPANRLNPSEGGKAKDVLVRNFFGIDIDTARRSSKVAASDLEIKNAAIVCDRIKEEFRSKGIPFIFAQSGNGFHLNLLLTGYEISESTDNKEGVFALLLRSLDRRFSNEHAHVDTSVFDAARIWKLYGTTSIKGGNTLERPWRVARMEIPDQWPEAVDILKVYEKEIQEQQKIESISQGTRAASRGSSINVVEIFRSM